MPPDLEMDLAQVLLIGALTISDIDIVSLLGGPPGPEIMCHNLDFHINPHTVWGLLPGYFLGGGQNDG